MSGVAGPADASTSDQGPAQRPDRFLLIVTCVVGLVLIFAVVLLGAASRWDKWLVATGIALLCGGAVSSVAVKLNLPALGQTISMGGTFAVVFILLTQVPDPLEAPGHGNIQLQRGIKEIVLTTDFAPIFVRHGNHSLEFLVTREDLSSPYWHIQMSVDEGGKPRTKYINCLPSSILEQTLKSKKALGFVLEPGEVVDSDSDHSQIFRLRSDGAKDPVGIPQESATCGSTSSAAGTGNAPGAGSSSPASASAPRPAPDNVTSVIPTAPASTPSGAGSAAIVTQATRDLVADNIEQRTAAIATLGSAVATDNDAARQSVVSWQVKSSTYDDDLGRVQGWLKSLRQLKSDSGPPRRLLAAMTSVQLDYLVALMASDDRALRLAARETVGWLLQANTGASLDPLLNAIAGHLKERAASLGLVEDKFNQPTRPRRFFIYNLLDAQTDAWCGFTQNQRQSILRASALVPSGDLGPQSSEKIEEFRNRNCG